MPRRLAAPEGAIRHWVLTKARRDVLTFGFFRVVIDADAAGASRRRSKARGFRLREVMSERVKERAIPGGDAQLLTRGEEHARFTRFSSYGRCPAGIVHGASSRPRQYSTVLFWRG